MTQSEKTFKLEFARQLGKEITMSHYKHLSIKERESILLMIGENKSLREIGRVLGRSASTISREIKRNCTVSHEYSPSDAERKYHTRRKSCRRANILSSAKAKFTVQKLFLEHQWSPEQISNRLKQENNAIQVSFSTIYRAIYAGMLETHKLSHGERGIARKLRHRGKTRHTKGKVETRGKIKISHPIEERPAGANDRSEFGHWEADTVAGKTGSSCIITLTDRRSRYLLIKKIPHRKASCVKDGMIELLKALPADKRRSVTPDRGKEFASHAEITKELGGLPFYFPHPHAPWQRGTNENTNGLIREYCPKAVDMESFDEQYFISFTNEINLRPRKCLGWKSPFEVFFGIVLHLT